MSIRGLVRRVVFGVLLGSMGAAVLSGGGCATGWSPQVQSALVLAGDNRPELEQALTHYRDTGETQKLAAAEFLIANMPGHGFVLAAFYDEDDNEVAYDALDYTNYKEALAAIDALEAEHGELHYAHHSRYSF